MTRGSYRAEPPHGLRRRIELTLALQLKMDASNSLLGFFTQMNNLGTIVVQGKPSARCPLAPLIVMLVLIICCIKDLPKLDLELYIQNYTGQWPRHTFTLLNNDPNLLLGRSRFERLLFIGRTCVPFCVDALKAAIAEAKAGSDVNSYIEAWDSLRIAAPHEPEAVKDEAWIEKTERRNKAETARLEAELKGYKNNLIKESIRVRLSNIEYQPGMELG